MSEREALLRAVCENPDDDTPRLVFADWLQEHGDDDRAEFIRAQVRFGELLRHGSPDADGLARRARELWVKHGAKWRAELPQVQGVTWHDAFFRGFPERVAVASDTELVRHTDAIFGQPIRQLVVTNFKGVAGFSEIRGLARLKTLALGNRRASAKVLDELLRCDQLPEAVLLECHFIGPGGENYFRELRAKFGNRLYSPTAPPPGQ